MFIRNIILFVGLLAVSVACKKESTNTPVPVEPTEPTTDGIGIEFYNPNPLYVDVKGYQPSIQGQITSQLPLASYSATLYSNGNETKLTEETLSNNLTDTEFTVKVPYLTTSDSITIVARNNNDEMNKATIVLDVEQVADIDPVAITSKDAFIGAEGHGRHTTGGRGGKILFVENLNDDTNQGSLRWAINQSGARTIVFRVSGTIELTSPLNIANGNLTIAGQSAPGDGICIAKNYVQLKDGLDNVVIRYVRFRNARGYGEYDAAWGRNCSNIIIDHCTFSWGNDEVASFYDNANFTMQWCIISESFYSSTHPKGNHGYGGIWGGMKASFHHNLIAHHTSRNPRFCGARYHTETRETEIVDFRNNVIYNWGDNSVYGGEYGQQNMVNNYYKAGPATSSSKKDRIVEITDADSKWYIAGNYVDGFPAITANNWGGGVQGKSTSLTVKASTEFDAGSIVTQTAEDAYNTVLDQAGASHVRDAIDARIVNEVQQGTSTYAGSYGNGIIDSEQDVGGFPSLTGSDVYEDFDNDGMADNWEVANGLNPNDSKDHNLFTLNADYTNIEVYLNSLLE